MNRPEKLNCLNVELLAGIANTIESMKQMSSPSPIVFSLKGGGNKSFCAGGDLRSHYDLYRLTSQKNDISLMRKVLNHVYIEFTLEKTISMLET